MLTHILHNSAELCAYFDALNLELSKPQRQHMVNMADALLTCTDEKTLAALQRQFLEAPDASNMADFLRISPWSAEAVRTVLQRNRLAWIIAQAERLGLPKVIYINLDDALGEKGRDTTHIEAVDWFHDHSESTRNRPRFKKGFCYLECTVRIGKIVATLDLRLYLREKTVRRLNRQRSPAQRLSFRSKNSLARQMLEALRPWLPEGWEVYVQFDNWYASNR